jgi:hypothetical protein
MPGIRRKHIDFDNVSFEETPPKSESVTFEEDLTSDEDDTDSVLAAMKEQRQLSGQEAADLKLRSKIFGFKSAGKKTCTKSFMERFPYKSCQREGKSKPVTSLLGRKRQLHSALAATERGPSSAPSKKILQRRPALVPDEKTEAQVKYVASYVALTALASIKLRRLAGYRRGPKTPRM